MHSINFLIRLVENHQLLVLALIFFGLILEGEVLIITTGVLVHLNALPFVTSLIVVLGGGFTKTFLGYYLGTVIRDRWSHINFFKFFERRVREAVPRFKERPFWSIFISKFIISANNIVILFSGFERVPFKKYLKAETLANIVWGPGLLSLGYLFSYTALNVSREVSKFSLVVILLIILYIMVDRLLSYAYQIFEEFYDNVE